uniref:Nicolin 1 n=1 Tax=Hucho hucho TaxID=62062 RepID=A0A4W5RQG4_9TELE
MSVNTVPCTVKPTVTLQIGDAETDSSRPGVYVIDVTLPIGQTVNIQEISFKNYYTAYVSVRLLRRDGEGAARWATCLRNHCLMPSPHTEEGSQDYCSVYRQQMLIEPDNVTSVRLILRQPSSAWLNFSVEDIKIHPCLNEDSEWDIPDWLSDLTQVDQLCDLQVMPLGSLHSARWTLPARKMVKRVGAVIQPCFNLVLISIGSVVSPPERMTAFVPSCRKQEDSPQGFTDNRVKGLGQIEECHVKSNFIGLMVSKCSCECSEMHVLLVTTVQLYQTSNQTISQQLPNTHKSKRVNENMYMVERWPSGIGKVQ